MRDGEVDGRHAELGELQPVRGRVLLVGLRRVETDADVRRRAGAPEGCDGEGRLIDGWLAGWVGLQGDV